MVFKKSTLFLLLLMNATVESKIPLCISLGKACGAAMILRFLNLRTDAYPFDWVTTPFAALYQAIDTDFEFFLTQLTMRPDHQGVNDFYGISFTHDLPTEHQPFIDAATIDFVGNCVLYNEWEQALPAVREKYARRIERFKKACTGSQKVYFFRSEDRSQINAMELRDLLRRKFPHLDFVLVIASGSLDEWNIEGVTHIYSPHAFDYLQWKKLLPPLFPDFNVLETMAINKFYPFELDCPYCLHAQYQSNCVAD